MRESTLQTKVLKALKPHGWFYKASDRFRAGIPDIVGCLEGRFVALELKIFPNIRTPLQAYEMTKIKEAGGEAYLVAYNPKTKTYKADNTEYRTLEELLKCTLKLNPSNTKGSASPP